MGAVLQAGTTGPRGAELQYANSRRSCQSGWAVYSHWHFGARQNDTPVVYPILAFIS